MLLHGGYFSVFLFYILVLADSQPPAKSPHYMTATSLRDTWSQPTHLFFPANYSVTHSEERRYPLFSTSMSSQISLIAHRHCDWCCKRIRTADFALLDTDDCGIVRIRRTWMSVVLHCRPPCRLISRLSIHIHVEFESLSQTMMHISSITKQ